MMQSVVWTIAGSDSCGGAGIQADLKTFHNLGVHGCSVITAVTAQNLHGVSEAGCLAPESIYAQIHAMQDQHPPAAIKMGMLGESAIIKVVREFLANYSGWVVLDPVMIASSGHHLFQGDMRTYVAALISLFPYIDLLTPNLHEAQVILSRELNSAAEIERGARDILNMGVKNVLIKGGHAGGAFSQDYWTNGSESCWIASPRRSGGACHGTGCIHSAAVAAASALGFGLKDALVIAKMYVNRGIRLATDFFTHATGWPEDEIDLPYLSAAPVIRQRSPFNAADQLAIGLYPVVDSIHWLEMLLPLGIKHIQLRIKNKTGDALEDEIAKSITLAKQYHACLFINDYWELAIRYGAYGVHLGQQDLSHADIGAIHHTGLRLGISTHCYHEVARAHLYHPSYLACGPIYFTHSKHMPFAPQGLAALARWRRTLHYPLVAIGGIDVGNIDEVLATRVNGVALISAITKADDPGSAASHLINRVSNYAA